MKKYFFLALVLSLSISASAEIYAVDRVIDSAALELTDGRVVRLIGIDPYFGKDPRATDFVRKIVGDRAQANVRLEFDVQKEDDDGRWLAYMYLYACEPGCQVDADVGYAFSELDDGVYLFLNETILAAGYGLPIIVQPNAKHADLFRRAHENAKERKWGVWADPPSRLDELLDLNGPAPKKQNGSISDYFDRGMIKIKNDF
ncbi:MAG TPA: thermonuclease family protein [Candidatus Omnitrophota bacterium]|nr:thermonuclease family protein [Candidatus Omnitrophota bacterium]